MTAVSLPFYGANTVHDEARVRLLLLRQCILQLSVHAATRAALSRSTRVRLTSLDTYWPLRILPSRSRCGFAVYMFSLIAAPPR